jgi:cholesterol transport system auxiliary component
LKRRALLTAALLPACSVLPDRPYLEVQRFALAPRRDASPPRRGPRRVLLLRTMRAAPGLDQRSLRSVRADGTEASDFYAEWTALPADLAEEALRRWLAASGLFAAIVAPGTRARIELALETELVTLLADLRQGVARCEIAAVLVREEESGGRAVAQFLAEGRAPLPAEANAAQRAEAMNQALGGALASLERALVRYA